MIKTFIKATAIAGVALFALTALGENLPKGWLHAGSDYKGYEMTVDREVVHDGKASASVKCVTEKAEGFGTLMQTFKPGDYAGKRLRLSGYVRSKDVSDWAGLWLRVDGAIQADTKGPELLAFDNMQNRAIKGTTNWSRYEIVLDVPERAQAIAFGVLLAGKGQVWMDDLKFEVVGKDVPTTGTGPQPGSNKAAVNLDFED